MYFHGFREDGGDQYHEMKAAFFLLCLGSDVNRLQELSL